MNKDQLKQNLLEALDGMIEAALLAANDAQQTASHADNQPENQYDTLSLEAAYLAHGQSERVQQLQQQRHKINQWQPDLNTRLNQQKSDSTGNSLNIEAQQEQEPQVKLGSVVQLKSNIQGAQEAWMWLAPLGGFSIEYEQIKVQLISTETPLAKALLGYYEDDEVLVQQGVHQVTYHIVRVY